MKFGLKDPSLYILAIGLCLIPIFAFTPIIPRVVSGIGEKFILVFFAMMTIIGITFVVFPEKYRQLFKIYSSNDVDEETHKLRIAGHHPLCGNFLNHTFRFMNHTFCAGCTGLAIGAIICIIGCYDYYIGNLLVTEASIPIFWINFVTIFVCILELSGFSLRSSLSRLSFNALFVAGWFMLFIVVIDLKKGVILDAYVMAILILSIFIRMKFSQKHHLEICEHCTLKLCHD